MHREEHPAHLIFREPPLTCDVARQASVTTLGAELVRIELTGSEEERFRSMNVPGQSTLRT